MVEDPELPFPESLAASEIHKPDNAARKPRNISSGISALAAWSTSWESSGCSPPTPISMWAWAVWDHSQVRLGTTGSTHIVPTGGTSVFAAPSVSPAYLGVGYIIGVRLASIQFAGSVLAWGLLVPFDDLLSRPPTEGIYSRRHSGQLGNHGGCRLEIHCASQSPSEECWSAPPTRYFKMRASLTAGIGKALADVRQTAAEQAKLARTERYMSSKNSFSLIAVMFVLMCVLYVRISGLFWPAILAAVVMILVGFFLRHCFRQSGRVHWLFQ